MRSISASPEIRIIASVAPWPDFRSPSESCQRVGCFHRGVELDRVAPLLARSKVRTFSAAEWRVIIDARRRQIGHRHARLDIALEMRGALEARRADAGAKAKIGVVGDR